MTSKNKNKQPKVGASPPARRQPIAGAKPSGRKRPVPGAHVEPDGNACLVFGLRLIDHDGPFAWSGLSPAEVEKIRNRCRDWESMRLGELSNVSGNKPIPAGSFSADAKKRWKEIELDDYDGLWELRLGGKPRVWGVLKHNIFYLVWWDPEHQVCPANLRHT